MFHRETYRISRLVVWVLWQVVIKQLTINKDSRPTVKTILRYVYTVRSVHVDIYRRSLVSLPAFKLQSAAHVSFVRFLVQPSHRSPTRGRNLLGRKRVFYFPRVTVRAYVLCACIYTFMVYCYNVYRRRSP